MSSYLKYRPAGVQLLIFGTLTFGIFLAISIIAVMLISKIYNISPLALEHLDVSNPGVIASMKALQAVSSVALFLVPSLVFAYLSDQKPMEYIGFRQPVPAGFFAIALLVILASSPMIAWLSEFNQNIHLPKSMESTEKLLRNAESQNQTLIKSFLTMKSVGDLLTMITIMAILPALAEELFFRGVLQRLFIQITKNPWAGIIFTAILFSALHGQFLGFIPRLVLGIVLGALFWFSGSLWPGILAHFINNALQITLVYYYPDFVTKDPEFNAWLVAGSTLIVVGLTWYMTRISQTSFSEVYDTDDDFHIGPRDEYKA